MLAALSKRLPAGSPAAAVVERLRDADPAQVDLQADRVLAGIPVGLDVATAPMIAAGLQLYWSTLVDRTAQAHGARAFGRTGAATRCPCCGSAPTASVLRIGGDESGTRYLHCSMCGTQWHYVRIKCAHCESTKGIHYQTLEGTEAAGKPVAMPGGSAARRGPAVKAECCDECGHYLKIVQMDVDAEVEPVADDLATLPLDLLLSEAGKTSAGVNPLIVFGDPGGD
jgi:FdhE protein